MKRTIILFFAVVSACSAYCQTYLEEGDSCFNSGNYACAITKYGEELKNTSDKDKKIVQLKLGKANNCAEWLKTANQAFNNKNYTLAKENYQKVLDSNPKDVSAKSRIEECNKALTPPPPKPTLRKATTAELTDIWNNKYGVMPERRQNLINVGIDPDDAQARINKGEGKATLSVSDKNISFGASGGYTEIYVTTNASDYKIVSLPSWCKVTKYSTWFKLECVENTNTQKRSDWFKVTTGYTAIDIKVDVTQAGKTTYQTQKQETTLSVTTENLAFKAKGGKSDKIYVYSTSKYSITGVPSWCKVQTYSGYIVVTCYANSSSSPRYDYFTVNASDKTKRIYVNQDGKKATCFNCPKTHDTWGLTLGFAPRDLNSSYMDCAQLGLKAEPLFKYGFGLNTGIILEGYSENMFNKQLFKNGFNHYAINVPLHLEYRLNFHKWFNMFLYGGIGFNAVTNSHFEELNLPVTLEYGAGFRISHVQFGVIRKNYLGDFMYIKDFGKKFNTYMDWGFSISYMF